MTNATRTAHPGLPLLASGDRITVQWRDRKAAELTGVVRYVGRAGFHLQLTGTVRQVVCGQPVDGRARGELVAVLWSTVERVSVVPARRRGRPAA